jgi:POT family proton-dependent oligopeptide transporter
LFAGFVVSSLLYPALSKRAIRIPITYRIAIGSAFGALSLIAAIIVDAFIRKRYLEDGSTVPIIYQLVNYAMIGTGEVFAVTSLYEAAFMVAPKEQKALASAIQLFISFGVSSFICDALFNAFAAWFPQDSGESAVQEYVDSELNKYMYVVCGISCFGVLLNVLPPVKDWVERTRQESIEANAGLELCRNKIGSNSVENDTEANSQNEIEPEGATSDDLSIGSLSEVDL